MIADQAAAARELQAETSGLTERLYPSPTLPAVVEEHEGQIVRSEVYHGDSLHSGFSESNAHEMIITFERSAMQIVNPHTDLSYLKDEGLPQHVVESLVSEQDALNREYIETQTVHESKQVELNKKILRSIGNHFKGKIASKELDLQKKLDEATRTVNQLEEEK